MLGDICQKLEHTADVRYWQGDGNVVATIKLVWVPCSICDGKGEESVTIPSWQGGYTTYKVYAKECTNCQGDGGHRSPVLVPDPEPEPTSTDRPVWWPKDDDDPAYD